MNEFDQHNELREIPTLTEETGVATDYFNVFTFFKGLELLQFGYSEDQIKLDIVEHIKKFGPLKHYTERYLPQNYSEPVVTEKNSDNINRLDEIVDYINTNFGDPNTFTFEEAKEISEEVSNLIYGSKGK